jgi:hypothetical protein
LRERHVGRQVMTQIVGAPLHITALEYGNVIRQNVRGCSAVASRECLVKLRRDCDDRSRVGSRGI